MSEMMEEQIVKKLNELIDLVKQTQPKVENHTHHHYPTPPAYTYPYTNPTYPYTSPWVNTGGTNVTSNIPTGVTWATGTNDSTSNGPADPTA